MGTTLAEKVWDAHVVRRAEGEPDLLYIDLHLVHEVTSPQAFDGLRAAGRPVRRPDLTLATEDHNVPTLDIDQPIADPISRAQVEALRKNGAEFGVPIYSARRRRAGHRPRRRPAARPHPAGHDDRLRRLPHLHPRRVRRAGLRHRHERGRARARHADPAAQAVQDDGHRRSTARCPSASRPRTSSSRVIAEIGTGGGQGYVLEYRGEAIRALSMEARMTICNMSIEAGARAGMIAPDQTTFDYLEGRDRAPQGEEWDAAVSLLAHAGHRRRRRSFDRVVRIDAATPRAVRHLGHQPGSGRAALGGVPVARRLSPTPRTSAAAERALEYMGLEPPARR